MINYHLMLFKTQFVNIDNRREREGERVCVLEKERLFVLNAFSFLN
jgi:hypothetical protein